MMKRKINFIFLSIGGNDVGFAKLVAWTVFRKKLLASAAKKFGATIDAETFLNNIKTTLPKQYEKLNFALDAFLPKGPNDTKIILTGYPAPLFNEDKHLCRVSPSCGAGVKCPINQGVDSLNNLLGATQERLVKTASTFEPLFRKMKSLAESKKFGWTFAGSVFEKDYFGSHGMCARDQTRLDLATEIFMLPCRGKNRLSKKTESCDRPRQAGAPWRYYNPKTENFPYAWRQRWMRTLNDVYMTINQKVISNGRVHEARSKAAYSEKSGAFHPNALGQAAMADALLESVRPMVEELIK